MIQVERLFARRATFSRRADKAEAASADNLAAILRGGVTTKGMVDLLLKT